MLRPSLLSRRAAQAKWGLGRVTSAWLTSRPRSLLSQTKLWLRKADHTTEDMVEGRSLVNSWLDDVDIEQCRWTSRILERWEGSDTMEIMCRVLSAWRDVGSGHDDEVWEMFQEMKRKCEINDKAHSIMLGLLDPSKPSTMDRIQSIVDTRQQSNDLVFWKSVVHALSRCSRYNPQAASRVSEIIRERIGVPDAQVWSIFMHAWAMSPDPRGAQIAQDALDHLVAKRQATTVHFNSCLSAWSRRGESERAQQLLKQLGSAADEISYLSVLRGEKDPEVAERLLYRIPTRMLTKNDQFVTCVLHCWSRTPDSGTKVEDLLMRFAKEHGVSVEAYAVAIEAWASTKTHEAPERGESLLQRMLAPGQESLVPSTRCCVAALKGWLHSDRVDAKDRLWMLFRTLEYSKGVRSNTAMYNVLLRSCERNGDFATACQVVSVMTHSTATKPDLASYHATLKALQSARRSSKTAEAIALWDELRKNTMVTPTPYTSALVVSAIGSGMGARSADDAENFWKSMVDVEARRSAGNALLRVWLQSDSATAAMRAEEVLATMISDCSADNTSFSLASQVWRASKRFKSYDSVKEIDKMKTRWMERTNPSGENRDESQDIALSFRVARQVPDVEPRLC